jgi:hypothetical protein
MVLRSGEKAGIMISGDAAGRSLPTIPTPFGQFLIDDLFQAITAHFIFMKFLPCNA